MRTLLLTLLFIVLSAPLAVAQSSDDARARELYANGALLYEEGDYENAVVAWKEAHRLSERPLLLYNIANALERIGEWEEAFDYLSQYRAFAPAEEREVLDRRMRSIERRVEDRRAEREEAEREAQREAQREAERNPPPGDGGSSLTTGSTTGAVRSGPHPVPIVLLGVGLGGMVNGGVFGGLALSARQDAAALCATSGDDLLCPDTAAPSLADDRTYSLVSDISFIAGGATAAAGLILAIVDATSSSKKKPTAIRIIPTAGPQGGSVVLVARF